MTYRYVQRLEAKVRDLQKSPPPGPSVQGEPQGLSTVSAPADVSRPRPGELPSASVRIPRLAPPSSAQLFDRLPSVADLDHVVLDTHTDEQYAESRHSDVSFSIPRSELDVAMRYFFAYINTAFQTHHEPSLRLQLDTLYDDSHRRSQAAAFTASGECAHCSSDNSFNGSLVYHPRSRQARV